MSNELNEEQKNHVQDFLATFNTIETELKRRLKRPTRDPFIEVLFDARSFVGTADFGLLKTVAELRNVLVHGPTRPYEYAAVPAPAILGRLKQIGQRLLHPECVLPRFQKEVEFVAPQDTLATVLGRIARSGFSQFPVYAEKVFKGLLTENGITRWFAHNVSKESLVETRDVLVRHVVREEEKRRDCDFVPRSESIDSVRRRFTENKLLEAVLITQTGARHQQPLGIISRWDSLEASSPPSR